MVLERSLRYLLILHLKVCALLLLPCRPWPSAYDASVEVEVDHIGLSEQMTRLQAESALLGELTLLHERIEAMTSELRVRDEMLAHCVCDNTFKFARNSSDASVDSDALGLRVDLSNIDALDIVSLRALQETDGACEEAEGGPGLPMMLSLPICAFLVMMSGLFSGLTLGLMGLDLIGLQIVEKGGDATLAQCAARIMPVRKNGNQLLCTLLLGNVGVNSALSILLSGISSGVVGFLVSTALIVIFGEIIPQAACSRYALQVGARTVPIVKCLMMLLLPLAKPMSLMLDLVLGSEVGTIHSAAELMEMLKLQVALGACDEAEGEFAQQVAEGALNFRDKLVEDIMTPLEDAYMLQKETRLGYETIRQIFETGFSRIPIYGMDKNDYKGLLYTKDLMLADPEDEMSIGDFITIFNRCVESFPRGHKLSMVLNAFKHGGTHMGLVKDMQADVPVDPRIEILGVITLEDIMEEILQEEIVDETDVYVDVDAGTFVTDGRQSRKLNLGVFNPVWKKRDEFFSTEEVAAIAAHLSRSTFAESPYDLSDLAIQWLIMSSHLENHERASPIGVLEPTEEKDWIYRYGEDADFCTLVLQGRLQLRLGRDEFSSSAGAFSVLAREAMRPGPSYQPDFGAFLATPNVRMLTITKPTFLEARELDAHPKKLQAALATLVQSEATRRKGASNDGHADMSPGYGKSQLRGDSNAPYSSDLGAGAASPTPSVRGDWQRAARKQRKKEQAEKSEDGRKDRL